MNEQWVEDVKAWYGKHTETYKKCKKEGCPFFRGISKTNKIQPNQFISCLSSICVLESSQLVKNSEV